MDGAKAYLVGLSDYVFGRTRGRLDGLTDGEYRWEPALGCWTVRLRGDGTHRIDNAVWPEAPPLTTLAWRLWHLITCYGQARNVVMLGVVLDPDGRFEMHAEVPGTAEGALRHLDEAHRHWREVVDALSDEDLAQPMGPVAGPYAGQQKAGFVIHQIDEFIHHGAELGVLRDLYRARCHAANDPLLGALEVDPADEPGLITRAIRNGHTWAVPRLIERGAPVDDQLDDVTGASPLHLAAGAGDLDVVKVLIEHGADPAQRDRRLNADAIGWARFYGRAEVAAYLAAI